MQWDFHRRSGKLNKKDRERGKTTWERWNDENMKGHIKNDCIWQGGRTWDKSKN